MIQILLLLTALHAGTPDCHTRLRGVMDVGSGTTKLLLARVEVCKDHSRVLEVLDDKLTRDAALEANRDANGAITEKGLTLAVNAAKELQAQAIARAKELAPGEKEIEFAAAGTHAVRKATNAEALRRRFESAGIPLTALTQEQEAMTGVAGIEGGACSGKRTLVWDIGGGSQQLTLTGDKPRFAGLALGAESFKSRLIEELGARKEAACPVPSATPNPIGHDLSVKAVSLAEQAAKELPAPFHQLKDVCVIGIGGVHAKAVEAMVRKSWEKLKACACGKEVCTHTSGSYTRREVECLAAQLADTGDCAPEIKGPYSTTQVSNLLMVDGFLRALHIDVVHVENVNMGNALAADRRLLKFRSRPLN